MKDLLKCFCRISNEPSTGPAQLTVFYAGSVIVYDSVSAEKVQLYCSLCVCVLFHIDSGPFIYHSIRYFQARAIMLLAGDGPSSTKPSLVPCNQVQVSFTKPSTRDFICIENLPCAASTKSSLVSPFAHEVLQHGELLNPIAITSSHQQPDPTKSVNSHRLSGRYVIPGKYK